MPFAFIIVGILLVTAGVRNKAADLLTLVKGDLTGQGNFVYWIISIMILGGLGYIPQARPLSRGLLVLVIVVLVLKTGNPNNAGGGVFNEFQSAISKITKG